ncbi:MAG: SpoIIE family protein phosphatase [Acidobacteriota bacterium]
MFRSITSKIVLLIVAISLTAAVVLILYTKGHVGTKMLEAEEKSVRNAIYLIKLNVENEYKSLLFHKMTALTERKNEMKDLSSVVLAGLERFYRLKEAGTISEEQAREQVIDWMKSLESGRGVYFFLYDENLSVFARPGGELAGSDPAKVKDVKGQPLLASMMDKAVKEGGGYATFSWGDSKGKVPSGANKLGYFTYHPGWKWVVGIAISIEDIEAEAQRKLDRIVQELKDTFGKTKVAQSGYFFLVNGAREILIHPRLSGGALQAVKNPETGQPLLDELMAAAKTPEKPIEYLYGEDPTGQGGYRLYESYVEYFKALDWYIVSAAHKDEIQAPARALVLNQTFFIAILSAVGILIAYLLVNTISKHLKELALYAKELPTHDFTGSAVEPSSIEPLARKYKDEVGGLAEAFIFMEDSLRQYIKDLQETTAAKERIESELQIAREIQMSMVPKLFPPFPEREEFDVFAVLRPAKEVGGDFYDFFFMDDDHLFFSLGDVSGKGVPASLFMAVTKTLIRSTVRKDSTPAEVLARVNDMLCEGNDRCMFCTVFCGILNVRTGEVVYADAGHNPSIRISRAGEAGYLEDAKAMALGIMEGGAYRMGRFVLNPGDTLFMYTDGVTEAMNVKRELFSDERLLECARELKDSGVREMIAHVMGKVDEHANGAPQSDDITMMVIRLS